MAKAIQLNVHPAAALFPMLSDEELTELATSISHHGLREPIRIITDPDNEGQWLVLDGRNRLEALRRMGVTDDQIFKSYVEAISADALAKMSATPEDYVLMANIERRNLTQKQRRDLAGKLAIMLAERQKDLPKDEKTDTLAEAAQKAGVSRRTAATAKTIAGGTKTRSAPSKTRKATGPTAPKIVAWLEQSRNSVKNSGHNFKAPELRSIIVQSEKLAAEAKKADEQRVKLDEEAKAAKAATKK